MGMTASEKARSGTREWLFQRSANLAICLWAVIFISRFLASDTSSYAGWQSFFSPLWFKIYTSITLLLICLNSVLAGWQIGADYVKPNLANKALASVYWLGSSIYLIAGMYILWGL